MLWFDLPIEQESESDFISALALLQTNVVLDCLYSEKSSAMKPFRRRMMYDLLGDGMFAPILPSESLYPKPSLKLGH